MKLLYLDFLITTFLKKILFFPQKVCDYFNLRYHSKEHMVGLPSNRLLVQSIGTLHKEQKQSVQMLK